MNTEADTADQKPGMARTDSSDSEALPQREPLNLAFRLIPVFGAVFVVTILAILASTFSDPRAPLVKLLNQHASRLITVEVVLLLLVTILAMTIDRIRTLKGNRNTPQ